MNLTLDAGAEKIIETLEEKGYKAYAVGGCVRDLLLGKIPDDYDVATSAFPEEVIAVFGRENVATTGLKHGTVTVILKGKPFEVTTFRSESGYSDHRRPDSVKFVGSLAEDLKRRDFTVNAVAYNGKEGLIDLYGGLSDLENGVIRAVGDPYERFSEDALRILRAARFSAALGFKVEEKTARAAEELAKDLEKVSEERIFAELTKLLAGKNATETLLKFHGVIFAAIPELGPCYKFLQRSKWHRYDVYEHTARAVGYVKGGAVEKWTMLLHDIGKPDCFSVKDGEGHFYGHNLRSAEIAKAVLKRLKAPKAFSEKVVTLVSVHDKPIRFTSAAVKREMSAIGKDLFSSLLEVKRADNLAQGTPLALSETGNADKL
ncbi:MAG TPA: CCA tRNA nucleotidyltransferase, partial [Clostridiales bacterium]|nr:CCA tRNA nucleotidyltransferase [Clostridiales bacterium]